MKSWRERTSHERVSLGVFVVLGLATLLFSVFRFQKSVVLPFVRPKGSFRTSEELEQQRTEQLKKADTDKDSIADYDELYIYRTSPFLEDSDSDGINDGAEISQGYDPNCPKGQTCQQRRSGGTSAAAPTPVAQPVTPLETGAAPASTSVTPEKIMEVIVETFGDPKDLTPEKIKADLMAMSSTQIRTFLTKLGVPQATLDKTDDATLRSLIEETLKEISAGSP